MDKYLIIMTGLPGTGKTILAEHLSRSLNYFYISQNNVRRDLGMKKMPQKQDKVLREIDRLAASHLKDGKGVIIDSVNRHSFRR